jgi:hypothetical protein
MILINPHTLSFSFEVPEMPATEGVQKILGFSRGWHHWNSVRLGASAAVDNGDVRLFNYSYVKGKRVIEPIGNDVFKPKQWIDVRMTFKGGYTSVDLYYGDKYVASKTYTFIPVFRLPIGYLLCPYFETDAPENKVMPFDVRIWDLRVNGREIEV